LGQFVSGCIILEHEHQGTGWRPRSFRGTKGGEINRDKRKGGVAEASTGGRREAAGARAGDLASWLRVTDQGWGEASEITEIRDEGGDRLLSWVVSRDPSVGMIRKSKRKQWLIQGNSTVKKRGRYFGSPSYSVALHPGGSLVP